jgi:hypothetical protein
VTLLWLHLEKVTLGTNVSLERHNDALTDGIDRRIRNLGEKLTEVVVDHPSLCGHACEGGIVAHGSEGFLSIVDHREHEEIELLDRVTEGQQARIGAQRLRVDLDLDWLRTLDSLDNLRNVKQV